jgi:hypothetical protein
MATVAVANGELRVAAELYACLNDIAVQADFDATKIWPALACPPPDTRPATILPCIGSIHRRLTGVAGRSAGGDVRLDERRLAGEAR